MHIQPIMLRPATLALRATIRLAAGRRLASTSMSPSATTAQYEKFMSPLKDSRILPGHQAYVWEVPKDLPENDFVMRRKAVAEHANGERSA